MENNGISLNIKVFTLFIVVIAIAFMPFWRGAYIFEDDVSHYYYPAFQYFDNTVDEGRKVDLVPTIFSGFPLSLSQVGGFGDPLNHLIFKLFDFPFGYNLRVFLNYLLSASFVYLFTRSLSIGPLGALVAAFAYITAQGIIPGMNILRSNSFFLGPGLFYVIHKLFILKSEKISKSTLYIILGIAIMAVSMLGGYTQLNIYMLTAVLAFAVYLLYREFSWQFLIRAAIVPLFSLILLFPHISNILEYVPFTQRSGGLGWESAKGFGSIKSNIKNITTGLIWPSFSSDTLQSLYMGIIGLASFLVSFRIKKDSLRNFFLIVLIFSLVSAFPYPLFWLMHKLPVLKLFRFPPHWFFLSSFSLSILAGLGFQYFLSNRERVISKSVTSLLVFVLSINFILPLWVTASNNSFNFQKLQETPWVVKQINELEQEDALFRTYSFYPTEFFSLLLIGAFNPPPEDKVDFNREYIQTHLTPLLWGMPTVRGFDNFIPQRYSNVINFLGKDKPEDIVSVKQPRRIDDAFINIHPEILSILGMMNVKYMWTIFPLPPEFVGNTIEEVGSTVFKYYPEPTYGGGIESFTNRVPIPIHLYKNKLFLPRVHIPEKIIVLNKNEENFLKIIEEENNFKEKGFIECDNCHDKALPFSQNGTVENLKELGDGTISFTVKNFEPTWVIISNSFIPGWQAFINGQETEIYNANYIYQGIIIPEGENTIVMRYE